MKRNLLVLSLVSILCAVGCNTNANTSEEVSSAIEETETESVLESSEESSEEICEELTEEVSEEVSEEASTEIEEPFSEVTLDNVEMTVKYQVVLKKAPSFKSEKMETSLEKDEKVTVIGLVNDQWYHVKKDDAEGFVNKSYLSEEVVPEFVVTDMTATKYAKQKCNLRTGPGTEYDKAGSLKINDEVKVTGITDNNWFRIDYNGSEAYVSASLLVDNKVETPAPSSNNGQGSGSSGGNDNNTTPTENSGSNDGSSNGIFAPQGTYCETAALGYVNELRKAAGVQELAWDSSKEDACKARAELMRDNGKISHDLGGGAPYPECLVHFIALSTSNTAKGAINSYAKSPDHYGNMITSQYKYMCCATSVGDDGRAYNVLWLYN